MDQRPADAPIALFVYARPAHTERVLAGLRDEDVSRLYVFSDGPRSVADNEAVKAVRELIREIDWAKVELVERPENLGLAQSIISGVSQVLERHEALVVLEDDCVPLPGFVPFMQKALMRYRSTLDVACVSGYGPAQILRPSEYTADGYFTHRISSWGWGTWRRAWAYLAEDWEPVRQRARSARIDYSLVGADLRDLLRPRLIDRIGRAIWTPLWLFPTLLDGGKTLWPFCSFIRNIGHDGSGANCPETTAGLAPITQRPAVSDFQFPQTTTIHPELAHGFARAICARNRSLWQRALARLRHHLKYHVIG